MQDPGDYMLIYSEQELIALVYHMILSPKTPEGVSVCYTTMNHRRSPVFDSTLYRLLNKNVP